MSDTQVLHECAGVERLFAIDYRADAAWTKSGSAYYAWTLFARAPGEAIGKKLGVLDLSTRAIAARAQIAIFGGGDQGRDLDAGTEIVAVRVTTGSPTPPDGARFVLDLLAVTR